MEKNKIEISSKLLYVLIMLGILVIASAGVYAVTSYRHSLNDIGAPSGCAANQILIWNGTNIVCENNPQLSSIIIGLCPSQADYSQCNFPFSLISYDKIYCDGGTHLFYYSSINNLQCYHGSNCAKLSCTSFGYLTS